MTGICPPEYPVETIRRDLGRRDHVEYELAQYADRWMWSVSWQIGNSGSAYRVGPKWKRFAPDRDSALAAAVAEFDAAVDALRAA